MGFRGEAAGAATDTLTDEAFLRRVESTEHARRDAELGLILQAAEWAVRRGPEAFDPEEKKKPFGERLRRYGGEGTPLVGSHAATDFALRLGRSEGAGSRYIATALDGQYRLPRTWERVLHKEVEPSCLMFLARKTRHLSQHAAMRVDADVVEFADGRLPWSHFEARVAAAIKAADPELAREREEEARRRQFARKLKGAEDGVAVFMIRAAIPIIARINATVTFLAQVLETMGAEGTTEELRVQASLLIADPPAATALLAQYAAWRGRPADPYTPPNPDKDPEPEDPESSAHPEPEAGNDQPEPDQPGGAGVDHSGPENPIPAADPDGPGDPPDPAEPPASSFTEPEGMLQASLDLWRAAGRQATGEKPVIDWGKLLPVVHLWVHTYRPHPDDASDQGTGLSRIEQYGPVTNAWIRDYLGPNARFTLRQVLDIEGQAPVANYVAPNRHRQAVRLMTPADIFPWGTATVDQDDGWPSMQVDHTEEWRPTAPADQEGNNGAGSGDKTDQRPDPKSAGWAKLNDKLFSRIGNYGPMTQFHHNLKTHGGMQVKQPFPGIYLWKDKWGAVYLVDHTGTRRIRTWTSRIDIDMDLVYVGRR